MDLVRSTVLCAALLLAACADGSLETGQSLTLAQRNPEGFATWTDEPAAFRLGVGDKVKVKFLVTRDMDDEATVGPDGYIGLRVAGRLKAEGETMESLQKKIAKASRRVLKPQSVTVSLEDAPSWKVYVGGAVRNPGAFRISDHRLNALGAVLTAGGFMPDARVDEVALIRRNPQGRPMLRAINVRQVIQTGADKSDVPLVPGDIVYVPRSSIGEVNLWIDQFIERVVPFQRTFNYTIGRQSY